MIVITSEILSSLSQSETSHLGELIGIKQDDGFTPPIRFELEYIHENDTFPDIRLMMFQGEPLKWCYIYTIYYNGYPESINQLYKTFHDGVASILRDRKLNQIFSNHLAE